MKAQLPVVTFRPEGHDQFMALMMYMVGVRVVVTYVEYAWDRGYDRYIPKNVCEFRGEIIAIDEVALRLTSLGLPKRYNKQTHYRDIEWHQVKMLEVIG